MARAPTNLRVMSSLVALVCWEENLRVKGRVIAGDGQPTKAEAGQWCLKPWSLGLVGEGTGGGWVFLGES